MSKEEQKEEKDDHKKEGILAKKDKKAKKRKSVNWDVKNLEDNELQRKIHPVTMKITEPKTPYTPYEEGDDDYFNKLNEVNKAKPTEDVLAQVINTLEKNPESEEEFMEIEVIEKDGTTVKKLVKKEKKVNKEFQEKKKEGIS